MRKISGNPQLVVPSTAQRKRQEVQPLQKQQKQMGHHNIRVEKLGMTLSLLSNREEPPAEDCRLLWSNHKPDSHNNECFGPVEAKERLRLVRDPIDQIRSLLHEAWY